MIPRPGRAWSSSAPLMSGSRIDAVWQFVATVVHILNPLILMSLALFMSVGYLLTFVARVTIDVWAALLWFSLLLPLTALCWRARRKWRKSCRSAPFAWRALLPALPLLLALPAILYQLARPSIKAIPHNRLYLVYSAQLYHGLAPPDNIFLPGYPANNNWLALAPQAALVKVASVDILTTYIVLNAVFLFSSLYWLAQALVTLELGRPRTLRLGFLLIFVYSSLNLGGILTATGNWIAGTDVPGLGVMMVPAGGDTRLHNIFIKLWNPSGVTPGVMAFTALLYVCCQLIKRKADLHLLALMSAALIVSLGAMPIFTPLLVIGLLGGLALAARGKRPPHWSKVGLAAALSPLRLSLWLALSAALSLPLVGYALSLGTGSSSRQILTPFSEENLRIALAAHWLLIPLFLAQAAITLRQWRIEQRFFLAAGVLCFIIALCISLPEVNQYKFHYLLSMPVAIGSLFALRGLEEGERAGARRWSQHILYALIGLAVANLIFANFLSMARVEKRYGTGSYRGIDAFPVDTYGGRLQAFKWIRHHTPAQAVIIMPHVYTEQSNLFHGRLNYVSLGAYTYADGMPAYQQRIVDMHVFYDRSTSAADYARLLESMQRQLPDRPFYAVVNDSEFSRQAMLERGAELVFQHPAAGSHVYWLNPRTLP